MPKYRKPRLWQNVIFSRFFNLEVLAQFLQQLKKITLKVSFGPFARYPDLLFFQFHHFLFFHSTLHSVHHHSWKSLEAWLFCAILGKSGRFGEKWTFLRAFWGKWTLMCAFWEKGRSRVALRPCRAGVMSRRIEKSWDFTERFRRIEFAKKY